MGYWLSGLLRRLARVPPPWLLAFGRWLAIPLAALARGRRRIVEANLALCLPELSSAERSRLATRNLRSTALSLFENLLAWHAPRLRDRHGRPLLRLEGEPLLHQALQAGHGAILLVPHFTMLELIPRAFTDPDLVSKLPDWQAVQVARQQKNQALQALIDSGRRRWGPTVDKKDARGMLRTLRAGHVLFYAPDQNFSQSTVFAPFFGVPAATTTATSRLARATGSPVLPCLVRRDGPGWLVQVLPPLSDFPGEDEIENAARINALIENAVREAPEQYLWAHRRFRSRPEGQAPLYDDAVLKPKHRQR
ncbi:MAG: lipid A biosynthesis lauroyl acyltransferase [Xanthomonadales bacterium]|nr:lipid A biosynthesis lauroyl acyltransferase [Xanthomonadales bacterium]